jgi:hypothetical protein
VRRAGDDRVACAVCDRRRDGDHQLERPEMTSSGEPAVVQVLANARVIVMILCVESL